MLAFGFSTTPGLGNLWPDRFQGKIAVSVFNPEDAFTLFVLSRHGIDQYIVCRRRHCFKAGPRAGGGQGCRKPYTLHGVPGRALQIFVFVVSSILAGLPGALYGTAGGNYQSGEFAPINLIEIIIWVALGGRSTLYGSNYRCVCRELRKPILPVHFLNCGCSCWGAVCDQHALFFPKGLVGMWQQWQHDVPIGGPEQQWREWHGLRLAARINL